MAFLSPFDAVVWDRSLLSFAAVLFSSVAIGTSAWYRQPVSNHEALEREAAGDMSLIETDMAAQQKAASALAIALAGEPDVAKLVTSNARDDLIARYLTAMPTIKDAGGLQNITFVDAKGTALARIHTPDKFGDDLTGRRKTVVEALATGKLVAGIEPGKSAVSMFASAPVISGGKTVGVVDIGTGLTNAYFEPLAAKIDGDITVHVAADGKFAVQASTRQNSLLSEEQLKKAFDGGPVQGGSRRRGHDLCRQCCPVQEFFGQDDWRPRGSLKRKRCRGGCNLGFVDHHSRNGDCIVAFAVRFLPLRAIAWWSYRAY